MLPQHQQDTYERQIFLIEPNSSFSDLSQSLSCWSHWIYLGKTPLSPRLCEETELTSQIRIFTKLDAAELN